MAGETGDRVNAVASIGDQRRASRSPRFAGGTVVTLADDISLDLREARPLSEGAKVRVVDLFEEVEFLVPADWAVSVRAAAIATDVEDREAGGSPPAESAPSLVVSGFALLGDIVVRRAG